MPSVHRNSAYQGCNYGIQHRQTNSGPEARNAYKLAATGYTDVVAERQRIVCARHHGGVTEGRRGWAVIAKPEVGQCERGSLE